MFTVPEIDKIMGPYLEKTYNKYKKEFSMSIKDEELLENVALEMAKDQLRQAYQGFETKLNTITSALGQIPFVTITLGLGTTKWERMVSKCILKTRIEGLGKGKITAVFPKISFLHRNEINGSIGSPNYDIKKLAIKCSAKRMYPDWLSLDSGYLKEVYDRSGKAISGMGCRAYLSPYYDPETGEEIYEGRFNIGRMCAA